MFAGFLFWKENELFKIVLISGSYLLFFSFVKSIMLKPFFLIWMIFATILGWLMTRLILSLVFYLILTPIGLILRIFRKQFLELEWNKTDSTYWNYRSTDVLETEKYEKQF